MINYWPQVLVASLMIFIVVGSLVRHGKTIDPKPINAMQAVWAMFTLAAVLGAGGFWKF